MLIFSFIVVICLTIILKWFYSAEAKHCCAFYSYRPQRLLFYEIPCEIFSVVWPRTQYRRTQKQFLLSKCGESITATDKKRQKCAERARKVETHFYWRPFESERHCSECETDENAMRIRQNPSTNYFNSMFLRIMLPSISYASSQSWDTATWAHVCSSVFRRSLGSNQMYRNIRLAFDSYTVPRFTWKAAHTRFKSLISHYVAYSLTHTSISPFFRSNFRIF